MFACIAYFVRWMLQVGLGMQIIDWHSQITLRVQITVWRLEKELVSGKGLAFKGPAWESPSQGGRGSGWVGGWGPRGYPQSEYVCLSVVVLLASVTTITCVTILAFSRFELDL